MVLLYGSVPDWRALDEGSPAQDVSQLNHDLVDLGYASRADIAAAGWDYYSLGDRRTGCSGWKSTWGCPARRGRLSLGQVVFEPGALRVSQVTGSLGGPAAGPVLAATSDRHVVTIPLDASQQSEVKAGDAVTRHAAGRGGHAGRGVLGRHGGGHHARASGRAAPRRSRCR